MQVLKSHYWTAIIDEYYDNVHWATDNPPSIYQWLKQEFDAETSLSARYIHFTDQKKYAWFMLRWSDYAETIT